MVRKMAQARTSSRQGHADGARIIKIARSWRGTPYHHQQSVKGSGCDCLGLIRGIYEELYQEKTAPIVPYSRDWADVSGRETLIEAAKTHLIEQPFDARQPGDVLVFRFRNWMVAKHAGLLVTPETMIHAMEGGNVTEVHLNSWWNRRIAAVFTFPKNPIIN